MAENTKIEWADATANFWIGCTKVSPACDRCYAERDWDHRKHRVEWGPHGDRSYAKSGSVTVRKVQRHAAAFIAKHCRKPRIFVNSLSDFADNHRSIDPEWRNEVWELARKCPDVILMILTKRPQNLPNYLPEDWTDGPDFCYPNVWIGTTAENAEEYQRRWPHVALTPAALRFVSAEPLLGDLGDLNLGWPGAPRWLITGGESGPGARPMHPDWARSLRDQCAAAGVPFHFKQVGEWGWIETEKHHADYARACNGEGPWPFDKLLDADGTLLPGDAMQVGSRQYVRRVGKKAAGRLLDGVQHDGEPA